ncbi:sulfate transporter family-domain-containing protein [Radiomyces spectabilis]|uniref:sulfate transporter family-domain-containing protein n=1 Tax=Radiomyces spectabilis TaxID=64574 RepID=UPI002220F6B3|nr:sulfate transporter family-domain-containing protein [Radiomyces spectabilis]KAI8376374.1 sulfate transporter family-domain-containing protein [Radiomyces spectabilis]
MAGPIVLDYEPVSYAKEFQHFGRKLPTYTKDYITNLFPIIYWIHRYNLTWLISDVIAGITVGIVVVPQGMGYAKIANLPPEFGLYSSFVGLCIYCFFGTSKDISIGPTAVMSLLVGQTITSITTESSDYTGPQVAILLALFGGIITAFLGLVRLGILVDFIPGPAIAGFMSGSAITITIGQWPKLFGIKSVNTQDSAYLVFGHFFKYLPDTHLDVAFGLVGLLWLYSVRWGTQYLTKKYPKYEKVLFFCNIMRNGILVIFGTLIAYLIQLGRDTSPISILKSVPSGFTAMGVPTVDTTLLSKVAGTLPSVIIILILEHVAIAKSFGRINNYKIQADQEIFAIGVANIVGSFFGAYPNTGSFSRTAITARSGARTPLTGVFAGLVVLLCLYVLTPAFYYIPDAILAAVIIHAVADLVSGPKFLRQLWYINPFELFTFVAAVLITFFTNVEYGIYVSVGLSIVFMLFRIARPRYAVLGRILIQPPPRDTPAGSVTGIKAPSSKQQDQASSEATLPQEEPYYIYVKENHPTLQHMVEPPPPGVLIFRLDESLTYPNASFISDKIMHYIQDHYASGQPPPMRKGDRAWNDRRPLAKTPDPETANQATETLPPLCAIVLDCSAVNHLDSTGVQNLLDLQLAINRYADREVEWHFASLASPAIRNALITGGFGTQGGRGPLTGELLPVVPAHQDGPKIAETAPCHSVSTHGDTNSTFTQSLGSATPSLASGQGEVDISEKVEYNPSIDSFEREKKRHYRQSYVMNIDANGFIQYYPRCDRGIPIDRYPFFHWDLEEAVRAATCAYARQKPSST